MEAIIAPDRSTFLSVAESAFNPGMVMWHGQRLLAWRLGWGNAQVWIGLLEADGSVRERRKVLPCHEVKGLSFEDPRLFVHDGALWLAYTLLHPGGVSQALAVLHDDFSVRETWTIKNSRRTEKNWQFFSTDDAQLCAVYQVVPHTVGRIGSEGFVFSPSTGQRLDWGHGEPRGGTPPVRIGDEYFSFFHSSRQTTYYAAPYAFSAKEPYHITRWPRRPMLTARRDSWRTHGPCVVFPCGAVHSDGRWSVSYGWHDTHCCLMELDHAEVIAALEPISPGTVEAGVPVIVLTVHTEPLARIEECLRHVRRAYPGAPLVLIVDGPARTELCGPCTTHRARLVMGEHLRRLGRGVVWWQRFFQEAMHERGDFILKIDADTHCWRPLQRIPPTGIFGTVHGAGSDNEHVQAGCMGFSREFGRDVLQSGLCLDPAYADRAFWSLNASSEAWMKRRGDEYLSLDCTVLHLARRLGHTWNHCEEIKSVWGGPPSHASHYAFTHSHKEEAPSGEDVTVAFPVTKSRCFCDHDHGA